MYFLVEVRRPVLHVRNLSQLEHLALRGKVRIESKCNVVCGWFNDIEQSRPSIAWLCVLRAFNWNETDLQWWYSCLPPLQSHAVPKLALVEYTSHLVWLPAAPVSHKDQVVGGNKSISALKGMYASVSLFPVACESIRVLTSVVFSCFRGDAASVAALG